MFHCVWRAKLVYVQDQTLKMALCQHRCCIV
uniref:Uncharacterized protein n=1 Tax=Anguilla anguilla TaxID=7936 RepID=A0A0E9WAY0_ANGAN